MEEAQIRGLAIMFVVAMALMFVALRKQPRAIWLFATALVIVGLGYLATTNVPSDLTHAIFGAPAATATAQ